MAIIFLQEKKRQRQMILIMILALVIMAILLVIWQGFLKNREAPVLPAAASFDSQKVNIDWQTLKDPQIESLQNFQQITPFKDKIGRKNPFIPY